MLTTAGAGASNYGFTGEWQDATSLIHLRARYYAPWQGRFLTADTWPGNYRQPLSLNKWLYAEGNPVNHIDPTGHYRWHDAGNSWRHELIEDYLESAYIERGLWKVHLEYWLGTGKGHSEIDLLYFPDAYDSQSAFNPRTGASGYVYELEPYEGEASVLQAQGEVTYYYQDLNNRSSLLTGATPDGLHTYNWQEITWREGTIAIPATLQVIPYGDGELAVWYAGGGAIMYADSNWDESELLRLPRGILFDWIENSRDSKEVQQFEEMVRRGRNRARVPEEAYARYLAASAILAASFCAVAYLPSVLWPGGGRPQTVQ